MSFKSLRLEHGESSFHSLSHHSPSDPQPIHLRLFIMSFKSLRLEHGESFLLPLPHFPPLLTQLLLFTYLSTPFPLFTHNPLIFQALPFHYELYKEPYPLSMLSRFYTHWLTFILFLPFLHLPTHSLILRATTHSPLPLHHELWEPLSWAWWVVSLLPAASFSLSLISSVASVLLCTPSPPLPSNNSSIWTSDSFWENIWATSRENLLFAYVKTKAQISCAVTAT